MTILKRLKPDLLGKRYEEIMCLLTALQGSPQIKIFQDGFIEEALAVKVTNRMISQIRRDFEKIKSGKFWM